MAVFVLDKQKRPLMPCTPKRALKVDPGSISTGIAVCRIEDVADIEGGVEPVMHIQFLLELVH